MPTFSTVAALAILLGIAPREAVAGPITSTSLAGTPLFQYETVVLTEEHLASSPEHASLLDFEHDGNPAPVLRSGECRAFPGTPSWPSRDAWDALDRATGGALIATVPAAASCYRNWGRYDRVECAAVTGNWSNSLFHEADPTSIMWPLFQGRTCLPPDLSAAGPAAAGSKECTLGGYPSYAVNVSSAAQVQLAVNFARNTNVRLVIKNTGHCFLGKSSGAGALSVWTHNLKDIQFLPEYGGAGDGRPSGPAFKVGAGVTVVELYRAADKNNVTAMGGIGETVGFTGGYIQGGGHTPMSGLYGMAADQVLALEVVTADGRFVTASATSNPDLFWALRGGGGGTFGVVTSAVVRARPRVAVVTSWFNITNYDPDTGEALASTDTFWDGVRTFFELFGRFTDAGTYSYFWVYNAGGGRLRLQVVPFIAPNHTLESFDALVKPLFERIRGLGLPGFAPRTRFFDAFYPAYHDTFGNQTVGWMALSANRLFPRTAWENPARFDAIFNALRRQAESGVEGQGWGGYHQAPRNRAGVDNAVSSAWRAAIAYLITPILLPLNATAAQVGVTNRKLIDEIMVPWRALAPVSEGGGSYLNEGTPDEPEWQGSYYGVQYPRLLEIKRRVDPSTVFYVTTGVGSEGWEVRDGDQGTQTQDGPLCRRR